MATILRYEVPVDGEVHQVTLQGPLRAVGCRDADVMEFWAESDMSRPRTTHSFIVYGTGDPSVEGTYKGTAVTPGGSFAWHLYEL
jgi:hypothetical protein